MSVYTTVDKSELDDFITQYNVGELKDYQGISAGIENTNYFVDTTQGRFVLTIFEQHTADELVYFLDLMALLADSGVPTAKPMLQDKGESAGKVISTLKGKPASLVTRLKGSTLENKVPTTTQCEAAAVAMAKMHLATAKFPHHREPDRGYGWRKTKGRDLLQSPKLQAEEKALLETELKFQKQQDYTTLPQGVIHADLFRDNAMFDGETLSGIIDLYYACNDSYLFDMAVVVNDWCSDVDTDGLLDFDKLAAFLQAYHQVRPLQQSERASWFAMLKAAALRFWLSRLSDKFDPREGELTQCKDPDEFKTKLKGLIATQNQIESIWVEELINEKRVANV